MVVASAAIAGLLLLHYWPSTPPRLHEPLRQVSVEQVIRENTLLKEMNKLQIEMKAKVTALEQAKPEDRKQLIAEYQMLMEQFQRLTSEFDKASQAPVEP